MHVFGRQKTHEQIKKTTPPNIRMQLNKHEFDLIYKLLIEIENYVDVDETLA